MENKLKMILAIVKNKGGVGKTTTVQNLAAGMLRKDKTLRILEIDLDPQCNLTLLNHAPEGCATVFESMIACKGLPIYKTETGVYYVPGSAKMQDVDPFLQNTGAPRQVLGACINSDCIDYTGESISNPIDYFDYIFIDCPPSLGLLTINSLTAVDSVLIPIQCEFYALEGVSQLMSTIEIVKKTLNKNLEIQGVLLSMFDGRTNLSVQVVQEVKKYFREKVYKTIIPRNVRLAEAPGFGVPIIQYDPKCLGAQAYMDFAKEFLEGEKK